MTNKRGIKAFLNEKFTTVSTIGSVLAAGAVSGATVPALGFGGLVLGAVTGVTTMFLSNMRHETIRKNEAYSLLSGEHELNDLLALASGDSNKLLSIEAPKSHLKSLKDSIDNVKSRQAVFGDLLDPVIELLTTCMNILSLDKPFNGQMANETGFNLMIESELPDTLESFYNSSDPANNTEIRAQFKEQIELLSAYTAEIIENYNSIRDDKVDSNGNYLESKYGTYRKTSDATAEQSS